jgi:hypothetical protein
MQPSKAHTAARRGEVAQPAPPRRGRRPRIRPKRTTVITLYTDPPPDSTTICLDELGPVSPCTYPPAPGWSPDGHRIKAPLEYRRGQTLDLIGGSLDPTQERPIAPRPRTELARGAWQKLDHCGIRLRQGLSGARRRAHGSRSRRRRLCGTGRRRRPAGDAQQHLLRADGEPPRGARSRGPRGGSRPARAGCTARLARW